METEIERLRVQIQNLVDDLNTYKKDQFEMVPDISIDLDIIRRQVKILISMFDIMQMES
jgi:hypothetical protein